MIKWARMSDLKDAKAIKNFFIEKGVFLTLYDRELPPIVLLPLPLLYIVMLERGQSELLDELRTQLFNNKVQISLGNAASTHYLGLLCHYMDAPIRVECNQPRLQLAALSIKQYTYWFADQTPLRAETIEYFNEKFRRGELDK